MKTNKKIPIFPIQMDIVKIIPGVRRLDPEWKSWNKKIQITEFYYTVNDIAKSGGSRSRSRRINRTRTLLQKAHNGLRRTFKNHPQRSARRKTSASKRSTTH